MAQHSRGLLLLPLLLLSASPPAALPDAAPAQGLPAGMCGNWQADYSALHREMLLLEGGGGPPRRSAPGPRYLIYVGGGSGLADVLSGLGTAMLFALLAKRAIMLDTFPAPYAWQWEWGYEAAGVQWSLAGLPGDSPTRHPQVCRNSSASYGHRNRHKGRPVSDNVTEVFESATGHATCAVFTANGGGQAGVGGGRGVGSGGHDPKNLDPKTREPKSIGPKTTGHAACGMFTEGGVSSSTT